MGKKSEDEVRTEMAKSRFEGERSLGVVFSGGLVLLGFLEPTTAEIWWAFAAGFSYLVSLLLSSYVVELEAVGRAPLATEYERLKNGGGIFQGLPNLDWSWVPMLNFATFSLLAVAIFLAVD